MCEIKINIITKRKLALYYIKLNIPKYVQTKRYLENIIRKCEIKIIFIITAMK